VPVLSQMLSQGRSLRSVLWSHYDRSQHSLYVLEIQVRHTTTRVTENNSPDHLSKSHRYSQINMSSHMDHDREKACVLRCFHFGSDRDDVTWELPIPLRLWDHRYLQAFLMGECVWSEEMIMAGGEDIMRGDEGKASTDYFNETLDTHTPTEGPQKNYYRSFMYPENSVIHLLQLKSGGVCLCQQHLVRTHSTCIDITIYVLMHHRILHLAIPLPDLTFQQISITHVHFNVLCDMIIIYIPALFFQMIDCNNLHRPFLGITGFLEASTMVPLYRKEVCCVVCVLYVCCMCDCVCVCVLYVCCVLCVVCCVLCVVCCALCVVCVCVFCVLRCVLDVMRCL